MPIKIQGLKGLYDLSNEQYEIWRKEQEKQGKITSSTSFEQEDRLYRNQQFVKKFGLDNFNKFNYQQRDELYKQDIVQSALTQKYGKDPIFNRLNALSINSKQKLLESDYQSDQELDNWFNYELKSSKKSPKKDGSFEESLKQLLQPLQQQQVNNYGLEESIKKDVDTKKKKNNALLEKIEKEDTEEKEDSVQDYSGEIFNILQDDLNNNRINGKSISDQFNTIGQYSNYYKTFQDSDIFNNLTTTDKMKYLSKFKALKDNYGEYTAAMWLENKMRDFVSENQSGWEWAGNTGKNIVVGGVAHIMDGVMGTKALFMTPEERAKFLQGKDINGKDLPDWLNPLYWQGVDQFNTFDTNEINKARQNGGISKYQNIVKAGEELDFFSWNTVNEVAKQAKYLWSDYLVGRLTGGVGNKVAGLTKGAGWLNKAANFTTALGTVAYSGVANAEAEGLNAFQETLQANLQQRNAQIDKEVNDLVNQQMKTKESQKAINDYVERERQKLKNKTTEGQSYIFDEEMWKQRGESLYREILTNKLRKEKEQEPIHQQDIKAAEQAANSAYVTTATIDELRAGLGNFLFKKFLFSKSTRKNLGDNGPKMDITNNADGTLLGKMNIWNKYVKPVGRAPLGEALEEIGDNVVNNLGQGLGIKEYMDYHNKVYNPKSYVEATDNYVSHFLGGTSKAIEALGEKGTWYEGFIGALGGASNVTLSTNFMTDNSTKEERKDWTLSEKINRYITNPIIHDLAEVRQVERETKQQIDAANKVLAAKKDDLLSISEMITSIKNRDEANEEDILKGADEKQAQAFTLMTTLNALGNSQVASQSTLYQNAINTINEVAKGNVSDDILTQYLGQNSNRTVQTVEEATQQLQQNAQTLLDMQSAINEAYDNFDKSALKNFQDKKTADKARNEIAFLYVMRQNWQKRLDEINQQNLGVSTLSVRGNTVNYQTKEAWERYQKVQQELVTDLQKNLEEVQNKIDELKQKESFNKNNAKLIALNFNKQRLQERIQNEQLSLETINKDAKEFENKDVIDTVLSEEEILQLNARDRATMLDPKNINNYNKEQQKVIQETKKNLIAKNPSLIQQISDAAILQSRIDDTTTTIAKMMENPIEVMEYINGLEQERADKVKRLLVQQAKDGITSLLDNTPDENLHSVAIGTSVKAIDDYIQKRPERKPLLEQAKKVAQLREDASAVIHDMDIPEDFKNILTQSMFNITEDALTQEQAIDNLEDAIDSENVDDTTKQVLNSLLDKLQELSYQRNATKVHNREERKKRLADLEKERQKRKEQEEKIKKEQEEKQKKEPDLFDNQQIDKEKKEPTPSKETLDVSSLEDVDFGDEEQETGTLKSQEEKPQKKEPQQKETITKESEQKTNQQEQELKDREIEIAGSKALISPTAEHEVQRDTTGKIQIVEKLENEPKTPDTVSDNPNSETLKGNMFYGYNGDALRDEKKQILNRGQNEKDTLNTVMNWLNSIGAKVQDIIDTELNDIIQALEEAGKTPKIQFMMVNQNESEKIDQKDVLGNVIFNVIEYTDEVKKIHNENLGGVITDQNGKQFLIVGTLGYKGSIQEKSFHSIRDRMKKDRFTSGNIAKRFYVNPNMYSQVQQIGRGWLVKNQIDDTGEVLRSLSDLLNDVQRNPKKLKIEDLKWGIKMYTKFATVNVSSRNIISPVQDISNAGNTFLLIEAANGRYIPIKMQPVFLNELNEGTIKSQIEYLLNNQLLDTDYNVRRDAINRLCKILYFDENTNILIGTESSPTLSIIQNGIILKTFNLNSPVFDRQEYLNTLAQVKFRINITPSVLTSPKYIEQLDKAGCFKTDIAQLYTSNADYTLYPVGDNGEPIIVQEQKNTQQSTITNSDLQQKKLPSVILNSTLYRLKNGSWFGFIENKEQEINDPDVIAQLVYNYRIQATNLHPVMETGTTNTYILNSNPSNPEVVVRDIKTFQIKTLNREQALEVIKKVREKEEQLKLEEAAKQQLEKENLTTVDISDINSGEQQVIQSEPQIDTTSSQQKNEDINNTGTKSLKELREGNRGISAMEIMLTDFSVIDIIQQKFPELSNEDDLQKIVDYLSNKQIPIIGIQDKESFLDNIKNCK